MAKSPVNKICVYCCNQQATTWDHVFAKGFLPKDRRGNLPQAPACEPCNNAKSKLENELTPVLPFGGRHSYASQHLTSAVPGMLAGNRRLHRDLQEGALHEWVENDAGSFSLTMTVPIISNTVEQLFGFITRGLAWKEWDVLFGSDCSVRAFFLTPTLGELLFDRIRGMGAAQRAKADLAEGALIYEGLQSKENPIVSAWTFSIYGGAQFSGADFAEESGSKIGVLTGRREFIGRISRLLDD